MFEQDIARLWDEVKPLYEELHAYVKNILMKTYSEQADKFPSSGQIPAHLLGRHFYQELCKRELCNYVGTDYGSTFLQVIKQSTIKDWKESNKNTIFSYKLFLYTVVKKES